MHPLLKVFGALFVFAFLVGVPTLGVIAAAIPSQTGLTTDSSGGTYVVQPVNCNTNLFSVTPPIVGEADSHGDFVMVLLPEIASDEPVCQGGVVFGNSFQIYVFSEQAGNASEPIHYTQEVGEIVVNETTGANTLVGNNNTRAYLNTTMTLVHGQISEISITLPSTTTQEVYTLNVGGAVWRGFVLTPFTLLPVGVFNVGGLDLLILVIAIESVILLAPLILLARYLTHKAIYAPHFSLLLWGHVVLIGAAALLFVDYQQLDQVFGGLSYFTYPIIVAVLMFLWCLHLFNRAEIVEILKPDTMQGHRLRYLRWTQLTGKMKDGRTVLIDPRWRGFLYALWGHYTTLIPAESDAAKYGEPAPADVENRKILSQDDVKRELARQLPSKKYPEDDFRILNAEKFDEPTTIWWVDSRDPIDVRFPHMTWHKWVEVPAKQLKDGTTVESHREQKLTWPHIIDPESNIRLAGIHYFNVPIAALGWSRAEEDYSLLEKRAFQVVMLRSRLHGEAARLAEEQLAEFINLLEGQTLPLNEQETMDETERRPTIRDGVGNWYDGDNRAKSDVKPKPRGMNY
jgi:hypothetical protein